MNHKPKHISQQDFELIDLFLNNNLTEKQEKKFLNRLEKDPVFKQQFEEIKLLGKAVEEQVLKEKLDEFHQKATSSVIPITGKPVFYRMIGLVASIVLILGIGGFYLLNKPSKNEKIFASYFKPDPGLATTMGITTKYAFLDAMVHYKQGKYTTAIKKWKLLLNKKPENDTLNYFLGVAYLAENKEDKAIAFLDFVAKNKQSTFYKEANYYLGLAYVKKGNNAFAKKFLTFSESKLGKQIIADLEN